MFKRGKYQDVILPFTVLRRIDSVLAPTKAVVLQADARLRGKLDNIDRLNEYRTALISAAVTGKIDVREEV